MNLARANCTCMHLSAFMHAPQRCMLAPRSAACGQVKSVTLAEPLQHGHVCTGAAAATTDATTAAAAARPGELIALFPDTVSERAQRHMRDLMAVLEAGHEVTNPACRGAGRGRGPRALCEHRGPRRCASAGRSGFKGRG